IETGSRNSAGECRTGRCVRTRRPWQRTVGEPSDAHCRHVGNQRGIAHHSRTVRRGNLDQPTADSCRHARNWVDLRRVKADRVVIDVPVSIGGKWSGNKGIWIDRSERVDSRKDLAGATVQLIDRAAETGDIDLAVGQYRMEYGLPASGKIDR